MLVSRKLSLQPPVGRAVSDMAADTYVKYARTVTNNYLINKEIKYFKAGLTFITIFSTLKAIL